MPFFNHTRRGWSYCNLDYFLYWLCSRYYLSACIASIVLSFITHTVESFRFSSGSESVCTCRISIVRGKKVVIHNNRNPVCAYTYTYTWKSKTPNYVVVLEMHGPTQQHKICAVLPKTIWQYMYNNLPSTSESQNGHQLFTLLTSSCVPISSPAPQTIFSKKVCHNQEMKSNLKQDATMGCYWLLEVWCCCKYLVL